MGKSQFTPVLTGFFLLLATATTTQFCCGQEVKISKVDNREMVKFAADLQVVGEHRGKVYLVRLFKVANAPSRFAEDSHEVDHFLYLLVTQYGEGKLTKQRLYKVGPFFYPDKFSWGTDVKSSREILAFTYLTGTKQAAVLYIGLDTVRFVQSKTSK